MAKYLHKTGISSDGSTAIIAGCFDVVSTLGVPLELIIEKLGEYKMAIDWVDYILSAVGSGQNERSLRVKLSYAVGEVKGQHYREQFDLRLDMLFSCVSDFHHD